MIEDLLKELQELTALQAKIEARLQRLAHKVKTNRANKNERNQYKSLKGSLQSATQKARSVKTSLSQIRISASQKMRQTMKNLMDSALTGKTEKVETIEIKISGPFDALPGSTPYLKAAKSAANRIQLEHPDFFKEYGSLPRILQVIWEYYASYHRDNFYESFGEYYVDEDLYENLLKVLEYEKEFYGNVKEE